MFDNEDFYPTPIGIVKRMIYPYVQNNRHGKCLSELTILEPSAGKGDILDGIVEATNSDDPDWRRRKHDGVKMDDCCVYCIESDPNLQHILKGKGYKLIGSDFLNYDGDYIFDLILMNPPFSNGDEHLLKAWSILREGDIACLLNSETIRNPCTEKRKLLARIIEDNKGEVEYLGNVFSTAERSTNVDVCLVRLKKITSEKVLDFDFEPVNKEKNFTIDESTIKDAPAIKDVIGNMLIQYDKVKELFVEYMKLAEAFRHYGDPLVTRRDSKYAEKSEEPSADIFKIAEGCFKNTDKKKLSFNKFCDSIKEEMWGVVFDNINNIASWDMEKMMTHSVRKNWNEFVRDQGAMDFTKENVMSVISMLFSNKESILERCIVDVFEIFTAHYKENRQFIEGWKTNDKWKVNKKIILPGWLRMSWEKPADRMRYGAEYKFSYHHSSQYSDIDKALCYITGKDVNNIITIQEALERSFNMVGKVYKGPHKAECESTFFKIKYFMKGTIHLEFKDTKLWEQFNLRACAGKRWLPEAEQKAYEESKKPKEEPTRKELLLELHAGTYEKVIDLPPGEHALFLNESDINDILKEVNKSRELYSGRIGALFLDKQGGVIKSLYAVEGVGRMPRPYEKLIRII